jgi:hypothetical protein
VNRVNGLGVPLAAGGRSTSAGELDSEVSVRESDPAVTAASFRLRDSIRP